jgi:hypothetical protein
MKSTLLIASIFATLLSGGGIAAAQRVDDPPGSAFQTEGIREGDEGIRSNPSVFYRTARGTAAARQARAYAYLPVPAVPHHKVVSRHR